jgi:hypothetical protein
MSDPANDVRAVWRRITVVMVACYPVFVLVAAVAHFFSPRIIAAFSPSRFVSAQEPTPYWQRPHSDWSELLYGPAITLVCVWAMLMVEIWIRLRFRKR